MKNKIKIFSILLFFTLIIFFPIRAYPVASNYITFTSGSVLTASQLNGLQTHYTSAINAVLDGDTFTGNILMTSGSDVLFYSDTGSTLTAGIYGDTGKITGAPQKEGTYGLTLDYTSPTLSLTCNNAACSASNPAFVVMKSTTHGQQVTLKVSGTTFNFDDDSGTSDIVGEEFGTTSGIAWANSRPFFLYAVNADDSSASLQFAISPNPAAGESPSTAYIGYHGNPATNHNDQNFFFLTSTNVTATHNSKPCLLIGAIRMQKSVADDWTVQTLDFDTDGIGEQSILNTENSLWSFPTGHHGAAAGKYIADNAGTAPTFNDNTYLYKISRTGEVFVYISMSGNTAIDGAGAVTTYIVLPYQTVVTGSYMIGSSYLKLGTSTYYMCLNYVDYHGFIPYCYSSTVLGLDVNAITNNWFADSDRSFQTGFTYWAFY